MRDVSKTKDQLIAELNSLRSRVAALEGLVSSERECPGSDVPAAVYQAIIENADGVPYQLDLETGEYAFIGSGIRDWVGVPVEHFTRQRYLDAVEEFDIVDASRFDSPESYHDAYRRGEVSRYQAQVRVRTPSGSLKWLSDCAVPLRNADGRVVGSLGILQDITDRKRSEQLLRASERRLQLALLHMPVMVMALDDDGRIVVWNRECERVTGYTADQAVGSDQVLEWLYPDAADRTRLLAAWRDRAGEARDSECGLTRRDGVTRIVSWSAQSGRCEIPGWSLWVVGVDVTERREAEAVIQAKDQLLEAIIEGTDDAVFVKDLHGRYLLVNSADALEMGRSRHEVIGLRDRDLFPPSLASRIETIDQEVLATKQSRTYEQEFDIPGRGRRTYSITKYPRLGSSGEVIGVIGIARDITVSKQAEQELRDRKEFAEGLIDTARAIVLVLDPQGRIMSFNPHLERLSGYTLDEVRGRDWFDVFLPEWHRDIHRAGFGAAIRGRSTTGSAHPIVGKDGRSIEVEWYDTVIRDGAGRITGLLVIGHDITDRLQAEHELRKAHEELELRVDQRTAALAASESRWRSLLDTIHHGIAECDATGTITFASPSLDRMMADPRRGLLGQRIWDLFESAESGSDPETFWTTVLRDRPAPTPYVTRSRSHGGTDLVCQIDWDYRSDSDIDGEITGVVLIITDITERTRAQESLRRSQRLIRNISDITPALLFIYDYDDGSLSFMNQRCVDFFDVPPAWVAWLREDFIFGRVHSDDANQLPAVRSRLGQLADEDQLEWEMRLQDRYDEWRWLQFWFAVFSRHPDGTPRQILATAIDVTDSKAAVEALIASEQEKSLILRSVSEHVSYQDENQRVLWANRAAAEAVGMNPDELVGKPCHDVWRHCEAAPEDCPVVRAQQTGKEESGEKTTPDGRIWNVRAYPVFDGTRCTRGAVVISQEITEAKRTEAEKATLQEQLHQSQKIEAVGQLASGTAHEFNNLLMVILAGTGQLRHVTAGDDDAATAVRAIEDAARQAEHVTKSLLTFCHRMPGEKERVNLGATIQSSVQLLQRLMPATIDVDACCDTNLWVLADKTQLQQITLNLAINARDAMPNGGRLVLTASPATGADLAAHGAFWDQSEAYARLDVRDTGTGMAADLQSRVFEPFFTTKVRGQGTGLGLAVVHGIVEEHGGHVFVESREGDGSTFTIFLPTVAPLPAGEGAASARPMPRGHGEVILLAEDHRHVREIIAATLDSLGYEVIQFGDGPALLAGYAQQRDRVRLLLVDVDLPGQSGLSCVRKLRADGVDVPAILSTGRPEVKADAVSDRRTVLLRKPFAMSELASVIRSALEAAGGD